jgi:Ni/Co efflux regulator RcnB
MRTLIAATAAIAVSFALPAMAGNNTQQDFNQGQSHNQSQTATDQGWAQRSQGQGWSQDQAQENQGQSSWSNGQQAYQGGQMGNQGSNGWQGHHSAAQLQQRIHQDLAQAGFTDIHVMPRSFVVHAKDRDGDPVVFMLSPNSVTALTVEQGGQNGRFNQQEGLNGRMAQNDQSGQTNQYRQPGQGAMGSSTMTNSAHAGDAINAPNNNGTTVR